MGTYDEDEAARLQHQAAYDEIEISLSKLSADMAKDETARLRRLIEEVEDALHAPGSADDKVRWLIDRLRDNREIWHPSEPVR